MRVKDYVLSGWENSSRITQLRADATHRELAILFKKVGVKLAVPFLLSVR